jgi:hypothetical protein
MIFNKEKRVFYKEHRQVCLLQYLRGEYMNVGINTYWSSI